MLDNTNQPIWQWPYSAFGDNAPTGILKPTTSAASAFTSLPPSGSMTTATLLATSAPTQINNLRFPGQYADSETGLFYNYFRSYQAAQGRYTQNDPIGLDGGFNRFGYSGGDAVNGYDPYGLFEWPSLPQPVVDAAAGFGDSMTLNGTRYMRDLVGGNGSVDFCSSAYRAGEYADIAFEVGAMGASALLKQLAKNASRSAVRADFRAATRNIPRNGGQLHHNNPLFGHPGGTPTTFPTGGLPVSVHSSSVNLSLMSNPAHLAAHRRLQAQEAAIAATLMNPALTGARAAKDSAQRCGCQ
jgi:RHS repeat-associated protein